VNIHVFDNMLDGVLIIDREHNIFYTNESFANLIDIPHKRLKVGKKITDYVNLKPEFLQKLDHLKEVGEATPYDELVFDTHSSKPVHCQYSLQLLNENQFQFYFRDITLEKNLQIKYRKELGAKENVIQQLDRKLFEVSFLLEISSLINSSTGEDSILNLALKKTNQIFNFKQSYFFTSEEAKSPITFRIESCLDKSGVVDNNELKVRTQNLLNNELSVNILKEEPLILQKEDSTFYCLFLQGKNTPLGFIVFEHDINIEPLKQTDLALLGSLVRQLSVTFDNEVLYYKSITDEKTKLYNNRYFQTSLKSEINRSLRNQSIFGLIIIDIDHFKKFNDTYGHQLGDQVLKHVALQIKSALRTTDIASRFGGEEFSVIMMGITPETVKAAADRVRHSIESIGLPTEEFGVLKVTASLGVSLCPAHASNEKDLMECADRALYYAKRNGRNNTQLFNPDIMQSIS
jgi:diguanylate cyclase (GGDEF)-like protein